MQDTIRARIHANCFSYSITICDNDLQPCFVARHSECPKVSAPYQEMALQYTEVTFVYVDIDKADDGLIYELEMRRVREFPTFLLYKDSDTVASVTGTDMKDLADSINQHKFN